MSTSSFASALSLLPASDQTALVLTRSMKSEVMMDHVGLFPKDLDLSGVYRMLDLACGQGEWPMEAARYLEVATLGLEETPRLVQEIQAYAGVRSLSDIATFKVMTLCKPLDLEDETFDLVHGAFLMERLSHSDWSALLAECFRVLTPGGFLLLDEMALLSTSSAAGQRLMHMCTDALWKLGLGLSPDGQRPGMLHALPALLQDAGGQAFDHEIHLLHYRSPQSRYAPLIQSVRTQFHLMQPLLTDIGYGSREELVLLCDQFAIDVRDESFSAAFVLLRLWSQKPKEPVQVSLRYELPLFLPVMQS